MDRITAVATNAALVRMHSALGTLANRRMKTATGESRVGRWVSLLKPYVDPIQPARERIMLDMVGDLDVSKITPMEAQILSAKVSAAQREFDAEELEITLPGKPLKLIDMPEEKSGEDGWKNAAQLAAIIADLGPLYEIEDDWDDSVPAVTPRKRVVKLDEPWAEQG
jgi:hypothetical protein